MAILGIKRLIFGVEDPAECRRFFTDFGLEPVESANEFTLPEGSSVILHSANDPSLPATSTEGSGVREVIWGVDSPVALRAIHENLARDRPVQEDSGGAIHSHDDIGLAIGFEVFQRALPVRETPSDNTPSQVRRWNRHRDWYSEAHPSVIFHVVFGTPDVDAGVNFYTQRLGFRVTDVNRGLGVFMRCDGRHEHHNLFLLKMPKTAFNHVSFGVENIDEMMAGTSKMHRCGWQVGMGPGRHRVSSWLFTYFRSPTGGQIEYSADGDYVNDDWTPSLYDFPFAHVQWTTQLDTNTKQAPGTAEPLGASVPKLAETVRSS